MPEMKSLGELWDKTWELYFKNFKFLSLFLLVASLPIILMYLFAPYSLYKPDYSHGRWIYMIVVMILSILLGVITSLSVNQYIYKSMKNTKVSAKQILKYAFSNFWSALGTYALMILMLIGLFILLVIPGIIFMVYWTFVIPVFVIKNLSGKKALDYSKSVVRYRWWKVLGYSIVLSIPSVILLLVISLTISYLYPTNIGYSIYYLISAVFFYAFLYCADMILFVEFDKSKIAKK